MILADSAQVAEGKLYILGGGWSVTGPGPSPSAIAIKIAVPWTSANQRHSWQLDLINPDGRPVLLETPDGLQAPSVQGEFEVGRPPGLPPGSAIDVPIAITLGPIPLEPGQQYMWQLSIDGHAADEWRCVFTVRPLPGPGSVSM